MARIRSIHFNAQADVGISAIDNLLLKPQALSAMLDLPDDLRSAEASTDDQIRADNVSSQWNTETAARFYLQTLLENQQSERLAAITSPERPELIPDMRLQQNMEMPLTGTQSVAFQQTSRSLPIFGTRAVVEIEPASRRLTAVDGLVGEVPDISGIPALSIGEVVEKLAQSLDCTRSDLNIDVGEVPTLCFYPQTQDPVPSADGSQDVIWKLAYHFKKIPVTPPSERNQSQVGCCGEGSAPGPLMFDYLVDANTGETMLAYPASAFVDVPVACTGIDYAGAMVNFDGIQLGPSVFEMTDPLRSIETYDASFADITAAQNAASKVHSSTTAFPPATAAAATAHLLASQVFDFFNTVLKRNSIDGKGMRLVSIVNCYNSNRNPNPLPNWRNAMWYQGKMWYGSTVDGAGQPVTTARFLDVMAHELAHGVTETTSGLVYSKQSGALNESFSDIFGIFIKNWYPGQPNPLSGWSWTLGEGWRGSQTILRSMENPTLGNQPAHMDSYVVTQQDSGGVHINSGIHNKAFYNVINSVNASEQLVFQPTEVAVLYYVTLTRLAPLSSFSDCRRTLLNVTTQRYVGQPVLQQEKLAAIKAAYDAVGIL